MRNGQRVHCGDTDAEGCAGCLAVAEPAAIAAHVALGACQADQRPCFAGR